jgi:tetratricopeptide (TPR) repeat protein
VAALIFTAFLIIHPIRSLLADGYYRYGLALIKEEIDHSKDEAVISDTTMPNYLKAVAAFETASALVPSQAIYPKALSELCLSLGLWAGVMEGMNAPLPPGALSSKEAFEKALAGLNAAVALELSNPDYHYALGCLLELMDKDSGPAEKELARAVAAYPINASIRYAVAAQHLKRGRSGDALEQARALAKITDNKAYLMRAFDITWSVSRDPEVVRGIVPRKPWAAEAAEEFLSRKIRQ